MKKFTLLLLMTVGCLMSYADDFKPHPFIERHKEWKVWKFSHEYIDSQDAEYELPTEWPMIFLEMEDTIISDVPYSKFLNKRKLHINFTTGKFAELVAESFDQPTTLLALFREELGKVYRYDEEAQCEYLFYDFTLKEGDKFCLKVPSTGEEVTCTVSLVDEITIQRSWNGNKNTYRRFHLVPDSDEYEETVWVEGLGNESSPLVSINSMKDKENGISRVVTATCTNRPYYFYAQPINEKHFRGQELINIFEGEYSPEMKGLIFEFIGDTLHVHGQTNGSSGDKYMYCVDTSEGIIKIIVEHTYQIMPTDWIIINGIDVYFPGFQPGEYVLGHEGGTVIGKVPNDATDIDTTKQEKKLPRYIIDISGLQLSHPQPGLNIINGKKVFIPSFPLGTLPDVSQ